MKVKIVHTNSTGENNYMYLIIDEDTKKAAIVDPVEPSLVFQAVEEEGVDLTSIFITHHHWDHAGGNKEMLAKKSDLRVYGNDDRIFGLTDKVKHEARFSLGSLTVRPLLTPCHTVGHVCYYVEDKPSVFTGDTLFLAGCGKFFEGTGVQMHHALINILSKLPGKTNVYCGHEYSVASLEFAVHVQPANQAVIDKLEWAKEQRKKGLTCIPSLMSEEMSYNPFMRVGEASLQKRCGTATAVETMDYLRNEKNNFKKNKMKLEPEARSSRMESYNSSARNKRRVGA